MVLLILDVERERKFVDPALKAALTVLIACLLIAPWSIRNTRLLGSFVQISTNGGVNFWEGNNPTSNGSTEALPQETIKMNEAVRDRYLGKLAGSVYQGISGQVYCSYDEQSCATVLS